MYKYDNHNVLTKEDLFNDLSSQFYIFSIIIGEYPDLNKRYVSPFRKDDNAGCFFSIYNNKLYFVDYATVPTHYDCLNAIQHFYNIDYSQSLSLANNINSNLKVSITPVILKSKSPTKIDFKIRTFNKNDLNYWNQYGIRLENLIEDNVFAVEKIETNRKIYYFSDLSYAYYEFKPRVKFYIPNKFSPIKWLSNCNKNDIGNLKKLDNSIDSILITKSYKDCRVLDNHNVKNTIWFQSENSFPSNDVLIRILKNKKRIKILFDNDEAGIRFSTLLKSRISNICGKESEIIFTPKEKDISDFYHKYNSDTIHFIKNEIL